jgi:hypothetical protein
MRCRLLSTLSKKFEKGSEESGSEKEEEEKHNHEKHGDHGNHCCH